MPTTKESDEEFDEDDEDDSEPYTITWKKDDGLEYVFDFEPEVSLRKPLIADTVEAINEALAKLEDRRIAGGKIVRIEEL